MFFLLKYSGVFCIYLQSQRWTCTQLFPRTFFLCHYCSFYPRVPRELFLILLPAMLLWWCEECEKLEGGYLDLQPQSQDRFWSILDNPGQKPLCSVCSTRDFPYGSEDLHTVDQLLQWITFLHTWHMYRMLKFFQHHGSAACIPQDTQHNLLPQHIKVCINLQCIRCLADSRYQDMTPWYYKHESSVCHKLKLALLWVFCLFE